MAAAEPEAVARLVGAVFLPRESLAGVPAPTPAPALVARGIIYPTSDGLTEAQFEAVSRAASLGGEASFYLSYAERYVDREQAQDFEIAISDVDSYLALLPSGLDHVLVSGRGDWGVYVLHDGVGVVAGSDDFVTRVYADLPTSIDQAVGFVREIRSTRMEHAERWARALLNDVLGGQVASEIWENAI